VGQSQGTAQVSRGDNANVGQSQGTAQVSRGDNANVGQWYSGGLENRFP